MNIKLTKPQAEFFQSTSKAVCAVAGFGSGKTQATMYRLISTMLMYPKADMLYSAPTIPLIRDILWAKLDEFLPSINLKHTINKSESIVYIHGHGRIFCRSMDNPARLVGFEVLDAFMDELDILPTEKALEVFRKIKARCRQKCYEYTNRAFKSRKAENKWKRKHRKKSQQFVSTTPEGFKATYELFKKNPLKNSHLVQMSTYSNPYLPDDYIDDLRESYPPQLIEAYLNGEFVNLVSKPVWDSFNEVANHVVDVQIIPGETIHIGTDFNVGRGCAIAYVKRRLPNKHPFSPFNKINIKNITAEQAQGWEIMIAVDEVYDSYDTPDTIRVLNEKFPKDLFPNRVVYPDASGIARKSVNATTSDIQLMKEANFLIRKRMKNPPIKDRVAAANAAFCNGKQQRKVYLDINKVPNYKDSLVQQVYDVNGLPEKGKGKFDDLTDAGTYPIYYHYPIKHDRMIQRELKGV